MNSLDKIKVSNKSFTIFNKPRLLRWFSQNYMGWRKIFDNYRNFTVLLKEFWKIGTWGTTAAIRSNHHGIKVNTSDIWRFVLNPCLGIEQLFSRFQGPKWRTCRCWWRSELWKVSTEVSPYRIIYSSHVLVPCNVETPRNVGWNVNFSVHSISPVLHKT